MNLSEESGGEVDITIGIVLLGIIILGVLIALVVRARRREEARSANVEAAREQEQQRFLEQVGELGELLTAIEAGDQASIRLMNYHLHGKWLQFARSHRLGKVTELRILVAYEAYHDVEQYDRHSEGVTTLLHEWHEAPATLELEVLDRLASMLEQLRPNILAQLARELGFTKDGLHARMRIVIRRRYRVLAADVTNVASIMALHEFIGHSRVVRYRPWEAGEEFGQYGAQLIYPANWANLVARLVYDPPLALFGDVDVKLSADHLRQWASDTVTAETPSLTDGKLILAYCDSFEGHRRAVGEILYAQLSNLVSRLQPELGPQTR